MVRIRRVRGVVLFLWVLLAAMGCIPQPTPKEATLPPVVILHLQGAVTPAMAQYLDRGLQEAQRLQAQVVILELDTPGGSVETMQHIIQAIRNSPIPVVVYVAPRGAMAASAGTLITLAGHLATMAPETTIGAASPVRLQGEDLGDTLAHKTKQILQAQARSLARRRGERAVRLAEATIAQARAVYAREALDAGLIDVIAPTLDDLLRELDGRTVETTAGTVTLHTAQAPLRRINPTLLEDLLALLTNPNIVFLLLAIGFQAFLIELSHPGGWVPGFVGVVSLALAAYGLGVLDVNWFGLVLLLTAFVLFVLDVKATTHGALTVAGLLTFIFGALLLFHAPILPGSPPPTPGIPSLSLPLVIGTALFFAALSVAVVTLALRAQKRPVRTGEEQVERLIGKVGYTRTLIQPGGRGTVQVGGELWTAELVPDAPPLPSGAPVEVVRVEKMHLIVQPARQRE